MEAVKHPKNMKVVVLDNESRHSLSYTSRNDKNKKVNDKNKKVNVKKKKVNVEKKKVNRRRYRERCIDINVKYCSYFEQDYEKLIRDYVYLDNCNGCKNMIVESTKCVKIHKSVSISKALCVDCLRLFLCKYCGRELDCWFGCCTRL